MIRMRNAFRQLAGSLRPSPQCHEAGIPQAKASELAELRAALCECLTGSRADFMSADALRARLREIDMLAAGKVHLQYSDLEVW